MKKSLTTLIIVFIVLCTLCSGCGDKSIEPEELPSKAFLNPASPDSPVPAAESMPSHILADGFKNVKFDADIVIPDNSTQLNIWSRNLLDINPDNVVMAFLPYFNLSYETNPMSDGGLFDAFRTEENKAVIRSWRLSLIHI